MLVCSYIGHDRLHLCQKALHSREGDTHYYSNDKGNMDGQCEVTILTHLTGTGQCLVIFILAPIFQVVNSSLHGESIE